MTKHMPISLLWTGGWDSTFRYLWLVVVAKAAVQPYYVIDSRRTSTLTELLTIRKVRRRVNEAFPYTKALTLPLKCYVADEVPQDARIAEAFATLAKRSYLGSQYAWLAEFAKAEGLSELELSVHVDDKAYGFVKDFIEEIETPQGPNWQVRKGSAPEQVVFGCFRFPILQLSKIEMGEIAAKHGFGELLEMAWFCHSPRKGKACGTCNPCIYTMEEGLARRVPLKGRMRYRLWLPVKRVLKTLLGR